MASNTMTAREIVELRLRNQHLIGARLAAPADVVGWLGAMQAQEYPLAKWSVGVRTTSVVDSELDQALADGTILRTHLMRPTWHFVLPSDIRWMQQLTAPRVHALMAPYRRSLGLDETAFLRCNALLANVLANRQRLTRPEISALVAHEGIVVSGVALGHLLMRAELDLVICSGGLRGKQQTYALLDERAPPGRDLSRDEALVKLTMRYYTSHGPATERDFAWWSGMTLGEVRRGVEMAGDQLESASLGERTYWFAPSGPLPARTSREAHVLQAYDEFVIAYSQSRDLLDLAGIVTTGGDERLHIHVVVVDGQLVARWRRVADRRAVIVEMKPERRLSAPELRAVNAAVERYAAFLEMPVTMDLHR